MSTVSPRTIATMARLLLWSAAIAILSTATLTVVAARTFWLADLATFAWPFLVLPAVIVFLSAILARRPALIAISATGLGIALLPSFALPTAPPATGQPGLRVITANLFVENERTPAEFIDFLHRENPDVVVLQEIREHWQEALVQSGLLPYQSSSDILSRDRMKVFSKLPILSELPLVPYFDGKQIHKRPVRLVLDNGGRPLVLYAIHPETPRRPWKWRDRNNYLALTAQAARGDLQSSDVIVAGDWNTPPWSPFFVDFLRNSGLQAAIVDLLPTMTRFSLRAAGLLGIHAGSQIDHVAVSPGISVGGWRAGPDYGSNHLPVIVDLALPR